MNHNAKNTIYKRAVLGGTFDFLHDGHKSFILYAIDHAETCCIGLTSDAYVAQLKQIRGVESYEKRFAQLQDFLQQEKIADRVEIVPINDVYGSTCDPKVSFDALIVSHETERGGVLVNARRKELNVSPLPILRAPDVYAEDGQLISSTRIRQGEIDVHGGLFFKPAWKGASFHLPEELREKLAEPFGDILSEAMVKEKSSSLQKLPIITVGDVTTTFFNSLGIHPRIAVIDFFIERKRQEKTLQEMGFSTEEVLLHAKNPSSQITPSLITAIQKAQQIPQEKQSVILVEGEEDLAVLPCLLLLPLGYHIYYGQPHKGMIELIITYSLKQKARELLSNFEQITRGS